MASPTSSTDISSRLDVGNVEMKEVSILNLEPSVMNRSFSDSFALYNGVAPCVVEAPSSKRPNNESHPGAAPSPRVNSPRGGKTRGRDEVG